MPPLQDLEIRARYRSALANWRVTGYVEWKPTAAAWVQENLEDLSLREVAKLMFEFVDAGGVIDQVRERRPEWDDYEYHYDLRLVLQGRLRYVESLLLDRDPTDPTLLIVSLHNA
jgi:hypothetical protein